ncbi:MAG: sulfite exporter TauE/SafE family protein [Burkholderiaceae bacterium]|nr:sulfite exporter TauE/SafE family protein [Burkholderiaceae bacterium]
MEFLAVLALGLVAGTVGGLVGFGTSIMLMPALVIVFGPREAVPIMAIASIMGNASRVAAWWREVDWRATMAYSVTAIPFAALGATTLLSLPVGYVEAAMGLFFIVMIPVRRWMARQHWKLAAWQLSIVGAGIGFLTGLVVSTGPINAPFFLMYGLVKGGYLATEALSSVAVYLAKAITFRSMGALPLEIIGKGLIVGCSLVGGAFFAKRFVRQLDAQRFRALMDGLLLVAGLTMLWAAWRALAR